jgi:hypothetical protein
MAPATVLTGEWATAEDTARALGVSQKRLKELKALAALALGHSTKRAAPKTNGSRPVRSRSTSTLARTSKAPKTPNTNSARTAAKKAGAANVPEAKDSVFLNLPYDDRFQTLFLGYIAGVSAFGMGPSCNS